MKVNFDLLTKTIGCHTCLHDGVTNFKEIFDKHNLTFTYRGAPNGHVEYTLDGNVLNIVEALKEIFDNDADAINEVFNASYDFVKYSAEHNTEFFRAHL